MPGHILIVEDHEPTAQLVKTVVEGVEIPVSTHIVNDGNACLAALRGEADSIPPPDLVLLDLGLPVIDGLTVLEERQGESVVCDAPTIVLSEQDDQETIEQCYEQRANAYISKPDDLDGYQAALTSAIEFWLPAEDSITDAERQTPHP